MRRLTKKKFYGFEVRFDERYYNIVRSVVDNFRAYNPIGFADGKGIFDSGIRVREHLTIDGTTFIEFKLRSGKLNYDLCKKTLNDLKQCGILKCFIEVWRVH